MVMLLFALLCFVPCLCCCCALVVQCELQPSERACAASVRLAAGERHTADLSTVWTHRSTHQRTRTSVATDRCNQQQHLVRQSTHNSNSTQPRTEQSNNNNNREPQHTREATQHVQCHCSSGCTDVCADSVFLVCSFVSVC